MQSIYAFIAQAAVLTHGWATDLCCRPSPGRRVRLSAPCLYSTTARSVLVLVPWVMCDSYDYTYLHQFLQSYSVFQCIDSHSNQSSLPPLHCMTADGAEKDNRRQVILRVSSSEEGKFSRTSPPDHTYLFDVQSLHSIYVHAHPPCGYRGNFGTFSGYTSVLWR